VRDAAGELADRFHLLSLQQARFEAPLLGEIVDDREEAEHRAVLVDLRHVVVLPFAHDAVTHGGVP
jgi:hypothetical protein